MSNNLLPPEFIEALRTIELHPDITDAAVKELAEAIKLDALMHQVVLTDVEEYLFYLRNESIRRFHETNSSE